MASAANPKTCKFMNKLAAESDVILSNAECDFVDRGFHQSSPSPKISVGEAGRFGSAFVLREITRGLFYTRKHRRLLGAEEFLGGSPGRIHAHGSTASCALDNSDAEGNQTAVVYGEMRSEDRLLTSGMQRDACEEPTVTRNGMSAVENNGSIVKSTKNGLDLSTYESTDCEVAESFGGGSDYLPFVRPPLWPFSLIRLFRQEEE
jgi:hypothetical protein